MKKICIYLLFACLPFLSKGQVFDPEALYLISCQDTETGGIVPGEEYPLMYDGNVTENDSKALWIIKEEEAGKYSIQNSVTGQYIQYAPDMEAEKYIVMSDNLKGNNTLFSFNYQSTVNDIAYWVILSVADSGQAFDKRKGYNAIGTYGVHYNSNQLYAFKAKDGDYIQAPEEPEVPLPVSGIRQYLETFTLNDIELAYDTEKKIHYYSIVQEQMDQDVSAFINFVNKNGNEYNVEISGEEIEPDSEYLFKKATANKQYVIQVMNGTEIIATEKLVFTGLPIVQLYTNGNSLSSSFSKGKIRVHEGEKELSGELLNAEMRYRGASAQNYSKKAFAIKLRDENWESIDRSFFGLRNDNYWILDAAAMDRSRIRNRVSTDIWNDFSTNPYFKDQEPEMVNATRGKFVEVFIDDKYWGLYCMTERIDRKQLKLKKYQEETQTIRGVLYKASRWSYGVMMGWVPDRGPNPNYGLETINNSKDSWESYEVKYPDLEDGEPIDWEPLYDVVNFVATSDNLTFKNYISQDVDLPVWLDYYLMMELILATDNHGKNAYYYMYNVQKDKMLGIAPWDMDGVLGIRWESTRIPASLDYDQFISLYEHGENNLFYRLKNNNVADFNSLLKKRYNELRFSYFTKEALTQRFADYIELFEITGAAQRETDRWNNSDRVNLDFQDELFYLADWISDRLDFLDNKYGPLELPTGMENLNNNDFKVYPNPVIETLYVKNVTPEIPVWIYTETGTCVYQHKTESNSLLIDFTRYSPGRYFIKVGEKGKVIIKK